MVTRIRLEDPMNFSAPPRPILALGAHLQETVDCCLLVAPALLVHRSDHLLIDGGEHLAELLQVLSPKLGEVRALCDGTKILERDRD